MNILNNYYWFSGKGSNIEEIEEPEKQDFNELENCETEEIVVEKVMSLD